jgi:DNA-binding NarL/FixJ family response regulator
MPDLFTILIVENHAGIRRSLREWITEDLCAPCTFLESDDGEAALSIVQQARPDVVLVELNLPGIDGLETARRIKALAPATHVLLLSLYEEPAYRQEAAAIGVRYVNKQAMSTLLAEVQALVPETMTA